MLIKIRKTLKSQIFRIVSSMKLKFQKLKLSGIEYLTLTGSPR
jgi:hypothetical protein